jgi:hypothetical protein
MTGKQAGPFILLKLLTALLPKSSQALRKQVILLVVHDLNRILCDPRGWVGVPIPIDMLKYILRYLQSLLLIKQELVRSIQLLELARLGFVFTCRP